MLDELLAEGLSLEAVLHGFFYAHAREADGLSGDTPALMVEVVLKKKAKAEKTEKSENALSQREGISATLPMLACLTMMYLNP